MSPVLQLIVLAAIALYLIFKLRSVLGTRDGFERRQTKQPGVTIDQPSRVVKPSRAEVDDDIAKFVNRDSEAAKALMEMKQIEKKFDLASFCDGAGKAYEWILISFAKGEIDQLQPFLSDEVYKSFQSDVDMRDRTKESHSEFVALRGNTIKNAVYEKNSTRAEITVEFIGELTSYVLDTEGNVIDGSETTARRQKDVWTFSRSFGTNDPNWILVATGE